MVTKEWDLSILDGMNIPEIKQEAAPINADDIKDIKHDVITEVNSLADFMKDAPAEIQEAANVNNKTEEKTPVSTESPEISEVQNTEVSQDEPEITPIKALADWAKSEQLFDFKEEEFEDSTDFLKNKITEVAQSLADQKLAEYPEEIHELAKNWKAGVPLDELIYSKSREIEYSQIKESELDENKELQKKLVTERLIETGYTEDQAAKKIKKYEDAAILDDEAKEALGWLVQFEKRYQEGLKNEAAQRQQASEANYQESLRKIENEILSYDEILPGIKESKENLKKIFEAYTKQDRGGKTALIKAIEKNPVLAWAKITKLLVLEDGKLDNIEKQLKTKVAQSTKEKVNTYRETPGIGKIDIKAIKRWAEKNANNNHTL